MGLGVWAATQRPSWVPQEMFSESEWSWTFTLRIADDRKKVARSLGFDQIMQPIRDLHGFWVATRRGDAVRSMRDAVTALRALERVA